MNPVERKPIYINSSTILLIFEYHRSHDIFDMLESDSRMANYRKDAAIAAKNLVDAISDVASIHFLQQLRKAIAEEIDTRNIKNGSNHLHDLASL